MSTPANTTGHVPKKSRLYDVSKIDWAHLPFSRKDVRLLLIPIILEQLLNSFMGMADTMMVSRVGSAAISAVSLTDSINILVIQVFAALATGGTILCSQFLGQENTRNANEAARQVTLTIFVISSTLMALCLIGNRSLLQLIFGRVEPDVMANAQIYFRLTAISFPFLALFQAGSAFYRSGGNSRFPMTISVISNVMNIVGNALFIFVFHWGVFGAALSTLISRIFCTVVIFYYLRKPRQVIVIDHYLSIRPKMHYITRILGVGIPSGIENGMFQFGKLAIQSSVSTLGTTAIAAQAMTNILENLNGISCLAIGIGMMTIVGQCIGAGKREEAKYYIVRLTFVSELVLISSCLLVFVLAKPVILLAGMEPEAGALCFYMISWITVVKPFLWNLSFVPAYGMRAAGDVRFSMITSSMTMWLCRVALAVCLIRFMGFGPIAVWIGMFADWGIRSVIFTRRFLSEKWEQFSLV